MMPHNGKHDVTPRDQIFFLQYDELNFLHQAFYLNAFTTGGVSDWKTNGLASKVRSLIVRQC